MKPPLALAAKPTPGSDAASIKDEVAVLVRRTRTSWRAVMASAWRVIVTGRATVSPRRCPLTSVSTASSACSSDRMCPVSSISVRCSPSGSSTAPMWAPEDLT